jgi:hypothetical protein
MLVQGVSVTFPRWSIDPTSRGALVPVSAHGSASERNCALGVDDA